VHRFRNRQVKEGNPGWTQKGYPRSPDRVLQVFVRDIKLKGGGEESHEPVQRSGGPGTMGPQKMRRENRIRFDWAEQRGDTNE